MTLGLYDIRTVKSVPVIAQDAPRRQIAMPVDILAAMRADAKQVNARAAAEWNRDRAQISGPGCNVIRSQMAADKTAQSAVEIFALLKERGPLTRPQMAEALGLTEHHVKMATTLLRKGGHIKPPAAGYGSTWSIA